MEVMTDMEMQRSDHGPTRWIRCQYRLLPLATVALAIVMARASGAPLPSLRGTWPARTATREVEWEDEVPAMASGL